MGEQKRALNSFLEYFDNRLSVRGGVRVAEVESARSQGDESACLGW